MTRAMLKEIPAAPAERRKLKVAYVIDILNTDRAGTENQLLKMIRGLDRERFDVHLVCFKQHHWYADNAASLRCSYKFIRIDRVFRLRTYVNFIRLIAFFRRLRPDVVHTFFPVGNIVGVLAARLAGVPCVISSRRDYGEWMSRRYLYATRLANPFATLIIANSSPVCRLTVEREHAPIEKVRLFYNGIDLASFRNLIPDRELKARLNIPASVPVVGIVANFRPMKHHRSFVLGAAEIAQQNRDVYFVLVGDGPLRAQLEALARELGVADRMRFVGSQGHVLPYLSIFDIGVNCSEMEGLSNAVMEYMAAGIPVVVSNSGGNVDLVEHDVTGCIFGLDQHVAMAQMVLDLLADPDRRRRLAANARKKMEREMSTEVMLDNYERLYEALART